MYKIPLFKLYNLVILVYSQSELFLDILKKDF